jgi:hypothetical protein
VLTSKRLAYFREEAGELMAVLTLDDVANVSWRGRIASEHVCRTYIYHAQRLLWLFVGEDVLGTSLT